jgi:penicillin-binding protein 1A
MEGIENSYFGEPDNGLFVDENGNPIDPNAGYPGSQPDNIPPDTQGYPPGAGQPYQQQPYPQPQYPDGAYPPPQVHRGAPPGSAPVQPPPGAAPPASDEAPRRRQRLDQDWMNQVLGRTPRNRQPANDDRQQPGSAATGH